jgi:hypothetical protein
MVNAPSVAAHREYMLALSTTAEKFGLSSRVVKFARSNSTIVMRQKAL